MNKFSLSLAVSSLLLTQIFAADVALQGVESSECITHLLYAQI